MNDKKMGDGMMRYVLAVLLFALVSVPALAAECVAAAEYESLDIWVGLNDLGYRLARCPLDDSSSYQVNWPDPPAGWREPPTPTVTSYRPLADRIALYITLVRPKDQPDPIYDYDEGIVIRDAWLDAYGEFRVVQVLGTTRHRFEVLGGSGYAPPVDGSYYNPTGADRLRYRWEQIPPGKRP